MFFNAMTTLFKFIVVAVFIGAVLDRLDIDANAILIEIGLTPDRIMGVAREGFEWALPHLILGAMVLVPIWVIYFLFRPPRLGK
ncbi:MAG: DUF6460 domain-containing protein [Parvibaculum sp.]|nr:DUF6460 domain-containing protein [Parvibaculum sp.]